ncbi:hypothetical protein GUJ93_ZPchr0011g27745 [Zizania palustris]|uniref:Uncharacterized protein n=1 Tax=Zizania palustris TaxID=103762 RepID=A0A8J6BP54_ZIZPA|nr:hypothetical protein GUJ93_ZPchr0011g27745 [Zizania palustris]KAG8091154.1 hypothetical protein GUJ93_ZPchr0011g27745 [Zizania palustris]KAG8091155.1 hypothetical protein GUJ93_ZPchr0011g27745 [Zizania palustris]KAG8091156.1 hypothetical protein GUJ93_ZPchr0011g27745 [Zizania palustris]
MGDDTRVSNDGPLSPSVGVETVRCLPQKRWQKLAYHIKLFPLYLVLLMIGSSTTSYIFTPSTPTSSLAGCAPLYLVMQICIVKCYFCKLMEDREETK